MINRVFPPAIRTCIGLLQLGFLFVPSPNGGEGDSAEAEAEEEEEDAGGCEEEEDANLEGEVKGRVGIEGGFENAHRRGGWKWGSVELEKCERGMERGRGARSV